MKKLLAIIIISNLVASCATKPPACSDKETLELMAQLFESSLTEAFVDFGVKDPSEFVAIIHNETKLTLKDIRTKSYDENAKRYSCEATVELIFNQPNSRIPKVVESIHKAVNEIENYNPSSNSFIEAYQSAGVKSLLNFLAIKTVDEFGSAALDTTKISGSVTYDSTFSESASKEKRHYLEARGMRPIANYTKSVFSAYGFTDRPDEKKEQQAQEAPVEQSKKNVKLASDPNTLERCEAIAFAKTYKTYGEVRWALTKSDELSPRPPSEFSPDTVAGDGATCNETTCEMDWTSYRYGHLVLTIKVEPTIKQTLWPVIKIEATDQECD